jgi:hypothetical protein
LPSLDECCSTVAYLYHERQHLGMCAVHALNSLLQSAAVSPSQLADIAQRLDAEETKLLQEDSGGAPAAQRPLASKFMSLIKGLAKPVLADTPTAADAVELARNSDEFGNFSSQVVIEALRTRQFDCRLLNDAEYARTDLARDASALIVNHETHWFTVRTVRTDADAADVWYDFNSFLPRPMPVQRSRLRAFLDDLRRKGYVAFVVTGPVPRVLSEPPAARPVSVWGRYFPTVVGFGDMHGRLLRPSRIAQVPLPIELPEPPPSVADAMRRLEHTFSRLHQIEKAVHRRLTAIEDKFAAVHESSELLVGLASLN